MSFHSAMIDGVFYEQDGCLVVKRDGDPEPTLVSDFLTQFLEQNIQITVHHWPPTPVDPERWGGGCCMWQATGHCPAGHHNNPALLLNVSGQGLLKRIGDRWWLDGADGVIETLPLDKMIGHLGRIVAVTLLDETSFAKELGAFDSLPQGNSVEQMEKLEAQTTQLRNTINDFMKLLKEMDKRG